MSEAVIIVEPEANPQDIKLLRGLERRIYKYVKKEGEVSLTDLQDKFSDEDTLQVIEDLKLKYIVYCSIQ